MSVLTPYPLSGLAVRMLRELEQNQAIFDLPAKRFFLGDQRRDLSVAFHGMAASSPLGPAAGPATQMAQNIVLCWLGGCRIMELKTVQVKDDLTIPRPCIDMRTVGYNIEWSQELRIEQSLEEYVKASMLIEMLRTSGRLALKAGFDHTIYDMSVGYDLAGIRSPKVVAFLNGMRDARETVESLRGGLAGEAAVFRSLEFRTKLSDSVTVSTFHGCPPEEIDGIARFLMEELGFHCTVKMNPMLLGKDAVHELIHDSLGYRRIRVQDAAFDLDLKWDEAGDLVAGLRGTADRLGLGFGIKLTNTLVVENDGDFLPASARESYLSGAPLHVLAIHLVDRFRHRFGGDLPISFSAGIDSKNFPDAVALGLVPVTVCTDLLRPLGYGRLKGYYRELARRMDEVGAVDVPGFIERAYGQPGGSGGAIVANTEAYLARLITDARYGFARNARAPRRLDSHLSLFDCITCDRCVPVCPNDANFTFRFPLGEIPVVKSRKSDAGWSFQRSGVVSVRRRHQIGNFADFCNDCGNCDIFCPEEGGPYKVKPRFFGSREGYEVDKGDHGFYVARAGSRDLVLGRFEGREYRLDIEVVRGSVAFSGEGFDVRFAQSNPEETLEGEASGEVDLTYFRIMNELRKAVLAPGELNFVSCLTAPGSGPPSNP